MENLNRLKTEVLVDLLSTQTDTFYRMQAVGASEEEFARCKLLLRAIHKELDNRKRKDSNIDLQDEEILAE
jgi:hypothetical protein